MKSKCRRCLIFAVFSLNYGCSDHFKKTDVCQEIKSCSEKRWLYNRLLKIIKQQKKENKIKEGKE